MLHVGNEQTFDNQDELLCTFGDERREPSATYVRTLEGIGLRGEASISTGAWENLQVRENLQVWENLRVW